MIVIEVIYDNRKKLIPLKFDLVFKKVFGDESDLQPIRCLLKRILNIDPKEINILNSEIIGKPYKDKNGKVFVVKPYCKHLGCELSWNNLEKTWDCPCHGSRYDYTGKLITEPATEDLDRFE